MCMLYTTSGTRCNFNLPAGLEWQNQSLSSFLLDIDECKDELHNCSSDESCVNQIGSFICLLDSIGCDESRSSQLKNKAIDECKMTAEIKIMR